MDEGEYLVPKVPRGDVGSILAALDHATFQSFQLVEPWSAARSNHPQLESIIHDMRQRGSEFHSALKSMVGIAGSGFSISNDCVLLCEGFVKGIEGNGLKEYITKLQDGAQKTHKDLEAAIDAVRNFQKGCNQTVRFFPLAVKALRDSGVDLDADDTEVITIPDPLSKRVIPGSEREGAPLSEREVQSLLFKDQMMAEQLLSRVEPLARWCSELDGVLRYVEHAAHAMRLDGVVKIDAERQLDGWGSAREGFARFKETATTLQDLCKQSFVVAR